MFFHTHYYLYDGGYCALVLQYLVISAYSSQVSPQNCLEAAFPTRDDLEQVTVPAIECLIQIQTTVPRPLVDDSDYGMGFYMEVVRFVESHVDS